WRLGVVDTHGLGERRVAGGDRGPRQFRALLQSEMHAQLVVASQHAVHGGVSGRGDVTDVPPGGIEILDLAVELTGRGVAVAAEVRDIEQSGERDTVRLVTFEHEQNPGQPLDRSELVTTTTGHE